VNTRSRGQAVEALALTFLQDHGLRLVEKNFQCKGGELDLIMREGEALVFVEVRGRSGSRFGSAEESVTLTKQRRVRRAAALYLLQHPELSDLPCRFDVVAVTMSIRNPRCNWIANAFEAV